MRILVVGVGAVGGYFGARLLAARRDVTFLVRPQRVEELGGSELKVISPMGDVTVPAIKVASSEDLHEPYDLILLSCKAYDLGDAMEAFAPAVGPRTAILPLLNGMAHMAALDKRFGREHVIGGSTPISAVRDGEGRIRHLNRLVLLQFGDRDEPDGARMREVNEALTVHGIEASMQPRIMQDMWHKWVSITTSAGMTCLMRASIGDIVSVGAQPLVKQLMKEGASIATAEGFKPTEEYLDSTLTKFTMPGSPFTASMMRDIEAGARVESQQIIGDLVALGRTHGLETPLLGVAHAHLRCYEERRMRESVQAGFH